jgi:hypothetical protein
MDRARLIIRARHDKNDPYFRFRRATAQDARLSSCGARRVGLPCFQSLMTGEINPQAMMKEGDLGGHALRFATGGASRRALLCDGRLLGFLFRLWLRFRVHQVSVFTIDLDSARQQQEKCLAHGSLGFLGDFHHLSFQF